MSISGMSVRIEPRFVWAGTGDDFSRLVAGGRWEGSVSDDVRLPVCVCVCVCVCEGVKV